MTHVCSTLHHKNNFLRCWPAFNLRALLRWMIIRIISCAGASRKTKPRPWAHNRSRNPAYRNRGSGFSIRTVGTWPRSAWNSPGIPGPPLRRRASGPARYEAFHRRHIRQLHLPTNAIVCLYTDSRPIYMLGRSAGLRLANRIRPINHLMLEPRTSVANAPAIPPVR